MPRKPAKSVPGTERFRDEQRAGGGPRMHGNDWHDHDKPKPLSPASRAGAETITEGESSGVRAGMGRVRKNPGTSAGRVRRKRTTPVGKGVKGSGAKGSRKGAKGTNRAGNPG